MTTTKEIPPCKGGMPAHVFPLGGDKCSVCGWSRWPPLQSEKTTPDKNLLLPCPFCGAGGAWDITFHPHRFTAFCLNPRCRVGPKVTHSSRKIVRDAWNTRSP